MDFSCLAWRCSTNPLRGPGTSGIAWRKKRMDICPDVAQTPQSHVCAAHVLLASTSVSLG